MNKVTGIYICPHYFSYITVCKCEIHCLSIPFSIPSDRDRSNNFSDIIYEAVLTCGSISIIINSNACKNFEVSRIRINSGIIKLYIERTCEYVKKYDWLRQM